jgi:hypothetical protein
MAVAAGAACFGGGREGGECQACRSESAVSSPSQRCKAGLTCKTLRITDPNAQFPFVERCAFPSTTECRIH